MKIAFTSLLSSFLLLSACGGGNPFDEDTVTEEEETEEEENDGTTFDVTGGGTPPDVEGPSGTSESSLVRFEERNENGGGFAENFAYDQGSNTFSVDNLAFDGDEAYTPGTDVAALGPNDSYLVYDAALTVSDGLDGDPIDQIDPYRAIVGVSQNTGEDGTTPRSSFAIVRTGGYTGFGFGGFVYQRDGGVVLPNMPTNDQAVFNGDYAGIRVFDGAGGLQYTQADLSVLIDWDDPTEAVGAVRLELTNREAFELDGTPITVGVDVENGQLPLPNIITVLDGDVGNISVDGDLTGELQSVYIDTDGETVDYETGNYYAILAGDTTDPADGGEIVGIIVLESTDPLLEVTAQETGGFVIYRDGP